MYFQLPIQKTKPIPIVTDKFAKKKFKKINIKKIFHTKKNKKNKNKK